MNETVLCPWCQSELLVDEKGIEDQTCPHCFNELGKYRSITISLSRDEKRGQKANSSTNRAAEQESDDFDDELQLADIEKYLDSMQEDPDLLAYEEAVEEWLKHQDEIPECGQCREAMVFAGEYTITENQFRPFVPPGFSEPFVVPPITMNMYVCTACYHTTFALNEEARMMAMNKLLK